MPYIETLPELVEALADLAGIYGSCARYHPGMIDPDVCRGCRICWTDEMEVRIRKAIANEAQLKRKEG